MLQNLYISGDLAGLIITYLDNHGINPPGQRKRLEGYDANRRMSYQQWWDELAILRDFTGKPHLGLDVGACIAPEHCGVLGYLCLSSSTLMEAALSMERYQRLLYGGTPAVLDINQGIMRCKWLPSFDKPNRESDEALLSSILHLGRLIAGDNQLCFNRIGFMHDEPEDTSYYEQFFGCDVCFGNAALYVEGAANKLSLPIVHANPALQKVLDQQVQDLLKNVEEGSGFLAQFKQALLKAMQDGQPTQQYIGRLLNVSPRTLHRRLQEHGLLFKTVLSETRLQLAKHYLQTNQLTLSEISLLLGYSEQSAFSRAFSGWEGMPPLAYQKKALAGRS